MEALTGSGAGRMPEGVSGTESPLRDRHERSKVRSYVLGGRPNEAVIGPLLHDMRGPAADARQDEQWREHRRGYVTEVVRAGTVEIEIREELLLSPHDLLDP